MNRQIEAASTTLVQNNFIHFQNKKDFNIKSKALHLVLTF